jgi:hypothetical protein
MTGRSTTVLVAALMWSACGPGGGPGGSGGGRGGSGGSGGAGGSGGGGGSVVCSRVNCAGCCNGNQCEPGTELTLCGKDAAACAQCGANQVCKLTQACGADPDKSWRVYPSAAQISPSDQGSAWDSDGSPPDVVITMSCPAGGGTPITGGTETESFMPGWATGGCVLKASELLGAGIGWSAADLDVIGSDPIASLTTTVLTEADFIAGQKVVGPTGGMTSITFRLTTP